MKYKAVFCFIIIISMLTCSGCGSVSCTDKTGFAMGSAVTIRLFSQEDEADKLAAYCIEAVNRVDSLLSANIENSDIANINNGDAKPVEVSAFTVNVIERCLQFCYMTGNHLDITVGAVTRLWGFDTDTPSLPDENELRTAVGTVDLSAVTVDEENKTVSLAEGQQIDLGAFGKGIACSEVLTELRASEIPAVVSVGGTVLLYGTRPDNKAWTVGIRDPQGNANEYIATLEIENTDSDSTVISTSGSYEKTFTEDGKTYHHILSPETGMPVDSDVVSVTVCSRDGLQSDALSTVLFITGISEESVSVLETYKAEAVFLCADGTFYVTDGLRNALTVPDSAEVIPLRDAV